jgi:predicted RNA-binding protein
MCQATAYLNSEEIIKNVLLVESVPGDMRLATLFETHRIKPTVIRKIDLIEHHVILNSLEEAGDDCKRTGESAGKIKFGRDTSIERYCNI